MLTNYQRGSNFERQIKDKLTKKGFYCMRSAGSHSVVDVCAISEDKVFLIQCKTSSTEELPNIQQLFKPTEVKQYKHKVSGVRYVGQEETKSNIKIFEEMKVVFNAVKIVLWKGKGTNNVFHFIWNGNDWIVKKGWF